MGLPIYRETDEDQRQKTDPTAHDRSTIRRTNARRGARPLASTVRPSTTRTAPYGSTNISSPRRLVTVPQPISRSSHNTTVFPSAVSRPSDTISSRSFHDRAPSAPFVDFSGPDTNDHNDDARSDTSAATVERQDRPRALSSEVGRPRSRRGPSSRDLDEMPPLRRMGDRRIERELFGEVRDGDVEGSAARWRRRARRALARVDGLGDRDRSWSPEREVDTWAVAGSSTDPDPIVTNASVSLASSGRSSAPRNVVNDGAVDSETRQGDMDFLEGRRRSLLAGVATNMMPPAPLPPMVDLEGNDCPETRLGEASEDDDSDTVDISTGTLMQAWASAQRRLNALIETEAMERRGRQRTLDALNDIDEFVSDIFDE